MSEKALQLARNLEPCICPFKTMIPMQGELSQVKILPQPCTTQCPLMKIEVLPDPSDEKKSYGHIALACGLDGEPFRAEIIQPEDKSKLKLI